MTTRHLTDVTGCSIIVVDAGGIILHPGLPDTTPEQAKQLFENIPNFKCRQDDVMLLSYPKTGTNWMNEIIYMLLNKSTEKPVTLKIRTMLEFQSQENVDTVTSPRCLNTHVPYKYLPRELNEKQLRTVIVVRNPKDTLVSLYHHFTGFRLHQYDGKWNDWLQLYMKGEMPYGVYSDYLKEIEKAMTVGTGFPFHLIHYEQLKQNGLEEVKKLSRFLGVDADEELCQQIVERCSFEAMKKNDVMPERYKRIAFKEGFEFYRKGQVGDWKNWFTVAENEQFDQYWKKEMSGSKLKFTYE